MNGLSLGKKLRIYIIVRITYKCMLFSEGCSKIKLSDGEL